MAATMGRKHEGIGSAGPRLVFPARLVCVIGLMVLCGPLRTESGDALPEPVIIDFTVDSGGVATLSYSYPAGAFTRVLRRSDLGDEAEDWRQFSTSTESISPGVLQSTFSVRGADRFLYRVTVE